MAHLATTHPTLLDVAKSLDPDGGIADVVELLKQDSPMLEDAVFMEGNLVTGHRSTVQTGIPAPTWRKLYGGVQPTKGNRAQVTDSCGMLEAYAEIDKALADLNGNAAAFRLLEDRDHIEGMSQELAATMIYGNDGTAPAEFTGFAPRYNSLSAQNADNIINAAGADSDNTSIWLIGWGPATMFGIYPKGSKAGLSVTDKGQVTIEDVDGNGGRMEAYRTHYRWDCGLVVRDWRYAVRICNIELSALDTLANCKNLITWMIMATERIPSFGKVRPVFYVNRKIREKLRLGILEKISTNLTWETVEGERVMMFDNIPVKRCDQLLNTETVVA